MLIDFIIKLMNNQRTLLIVLVTFMLVSPSLSCSAGEFEEISTGLCLPCSDNTFSVDGNATQCEVCTNCADCDPFTGNCTACAAGQEPSDGLCSPCLPDTFSSGQSLCQPCDNSCVTCEPINGFCLSCSPGSGLNQAVCSPCSMSQFTNPSTFSCDLCDDSCMTCDGAGPNNCKSCQLDFGLQNKTCTICFNGTTSDGFHPCQTCTTSNCSSCDQFDTCLTCNSGLTLLADKECAYACETENANCKLCQFNNSCVECMPNYTLNLTGNLCSLCSIYECTQCQNGNCTACNGLLVPSFDNKQCLMCEVSNCQSCSQNQYCMTCLGSFAPILGECFLCGVNHCANCDNSNGLLICLGCDANYIFDPTTNRCNAVNCTVENCLHCDQTSICGICATNFTVDNGTCFGNCGVTNCISCNGTVCEVCISNYVVVGTVCSLACEIDNCLTCSDSSLGICQVCSSGLVPSTDGSSCVSCNVDNCLFCNSNEVCGKCSGNFQLQSGKCVTCQINDCMICSANNICAMCLDGYSLSTVIGSFVTLQCVACLEPCATCYPDGTCQTCLSPYSQVPMTSGQNCFFCSNPSCISCSDTNIGSCSQCQEGYSLVSGDCQPFCSSGCTSCSNSLSCNTCSSQFLFLQNSQCKTCSNVPACLNCQASNKDICLLCNTGFYLQQGNCFPCSSFCNVCNSTYFCSQLIDSVGHTLVKRTAISNAPAACDPGCRSCSSVNPSICSQCLSGLYLSQQNICKPCTSSSLCASCAQLNPSLCLTCFKGSFLDSNSACIKCSFPCTSCFNNNPSACSACVQGYVLLSTSNTCQTASEIQLNLNIQAVQNCANSKVVRTGTVNVVSCSLCIKGFALTAAGCAPCISGCQICNPSTLTTCTQCAPGFLLDQNKICTSNLVCSSNCQTCTSLGCVACESGYFLNHSFQCQLFCVFPCASCMSTDPTTCLICLSGYFMSNSGICLPDTSCNTNVDCLVCPLGTTLLINNSPSKINQTCVSCSSNCARCLTSTPSTCTSCTIGKYLNGTSCSNCPSGCAECISLTQCTKCSQSFIPAQSGTLSGTATSGLLNCTSCSFPCSGCKGDSTSCISCQSGFTLKNQVCLSNFNFVIRCVFPVTLPQFQNNYLSFLNQVASAAAVKIQNIVISSITSGSVNLGMSVSSLNSPGSSGSVRAQSNLNSLLSSGNIANMPVSSFALSTVGGSNGDDSNTDSNNGSGLALTTIIILAIVIPLGVVLILVGSFLIYYHRRRLRLRQFPPPRYSPQAQRRQQIELSTYPSARTDKLPLL